MAAASTTIVCALESNASAPQTAIRGRQHAPPSNYKEWDFLKGEGPSAPERFYDPLEKKAFKPGWQSIRQQQDIQQDVERKAWEAQQEMKATHTFAQRQANVRLRELEHGFNPITGAEFNKGTGRWQEPSDPWAHQKLGLRSVHTIAATKHVDGVQAAGATMPPADKADSLSKVAELRRERIQNGGLSAAQREHGGVKALLSWQS